MSSRGKSLIHGDVTVSRALLLTSSRKIPQDAPSEAAEELEDPLETLFGMVHGVLINVRFPVGPSGKPNFADAWSAMIDR